MSLKPWPDATTAWTWLPRIWADNNDYQGGASTTLVPKVELIPGQTALSL